MHFKMSSAICFSLEQSKILSSCIELKEEVFRNEETWRANEICFKRGNFGQSNNL